MRLALERLTVPGALDGVSLGVGDGEAVALLGANGAGKSTLLRAVIGLVSPSSGAIRLDDTDIAALRPERRAREGIGYVPEGRRVFPGMTVRDNLLVACREDPASLLATVHALFPVLEERQKQLAWSLSGGQQQMLAIGRALMTRPRLLLLDEPSLGLSPKLAAELFLRIGEIAARGTSVILAEQNVAGALRICRRGYVLRLGRVVAEGSSAALLENPDLRGTILP
jgi:branched-chain amino acid transport system ATP-binding protein